MFWLIVLMIVVSLGAVAWWSSGRQRRGVNDDSVRRTREADVDRGDRYGGTGSFGGQPGG